MMKLYMNKTISTVLFHTAWMSAAVAFTHWAIGTEKIALYHIVVGILLSSLNFRIAYWVEKYHEKCDVPVGEGVQPVARSRSRRKRPVVAGVVGTIGGAVATNS